MSLPPAVRPDELERRLRAHLDALGPAPRAELLHLLTLLDFDRVGAIQSYWSNPKTRAFGELLIDCEEDPDAMGGAARDAAREPRWGKDTLQAVATGHAHHRASLP